jgi:hypothetical protein
LFYFYPTNSVFNPSASAGSIIKEKFENWSTRETGERAKQKGNNDNESSQN